jgi:hypothetical protein
VAWYIAVPAPAAASVPLIAGAAGVYLFPTVVASGNCANVIATLPTPPWTLIIGSLMAEVVVNLKQKQKKENVDVVLVTGPSENVHCHPDPVGGVSEDEATVLHDTDEMTAVPLIRLTEPEPVVQE